METSHAADAFGAPNDEGMRERQYQHQHQHQPDEDETLTGRLRELKLDPCLQGVRNSYGDDQILGFWTAAMPCDEVAPPSLPPTKDQGSDPSEGMIMRRIRGGNRAETSRLHQSSYRNIT